MKYEAKDVGGVATSQAASTPWVSITQTDAIAECSDIGAHLCTVDEAQTINRNIEAQAANWANGVIGSTVVSGGGLKRGNVGIADSTSYDGANPDFGTVRNELAKLVLSNEQEIWDWSGNVYEWIYGEGASGTVGTSGGVNWRSTATWVDWNEADLNDERQVLGPSDNGWTATQGIGQYSGGASTNAFYRGGNWGHAIGGVFALLLDLPPSFSTTAIGLRCCSAISSTPLPTHTTFTSQETTNFSEATLSSVTSLTLAIDNKGKIAFPLGHSINAENEDYDSNVKIEDAMIYVNSAALDSTFNSSATLTFYNVDCNKPYVFYSETASTFASILSENQRCLESLCTNIQCEGSTLTVDVAHFTGFAAGADANLTTEAEAGVFYPLDPIEFTAEYINSTDGTPISGECNITFDDEGIWHTMDFDSTDYNYTKSFASAGTHDYNVTCSSANFVTLEANDTKLVSSVDIPEFSIITLGFGLIAVLIGLVVIRKKK